MPGHLDGTAAQRLDFGGITTTWTLDGVTRRRAGLRLAGRTAPVEAPDKYRRLEHRRRQAQIAARHVLDRSEDLDAYRR